MIQRALALLLVLAAIAGPVPASAADYPADCGVENADKLVENFHRVDAEMYRGGRPAYRDDVYMKFADIGIRTVMNLEGGDQAKQEKAVVDRVNLQLMKQSKPPIRFVSFPIESFTETMVSAPSQKDMSALFAEIEKAPKPIYVHCKRGKDRTGMVVLLYRVWRGEESFEQAYNEARYYHFSAWNFGLKRLLEDYREGGLKSLGAPPTSPLAGVCEPGRLKAAAKAAVAPAKPTGTASNTPEKH